MTKCYSMSNLIQAMKRRVRGKKAKESPEWCEGTPDIRRTWPWSMRRRMMKRPGSSRYRTGVPCTSQGLSGDGKANMGGTTKQNPSSRREEGFFVPGIVISTKS